MSLFDQLHHDWQLRLVHLEKNFAEIERIIFGQRVAPEYENILRALKVPIRSVRVVIFGQDPYPTPGVANGLAFSISPGTTKLPGTLRNIFKELKDDCGVNSPQNGDLSHWADQGVLLLNRVLTTESPNSLVHAKIGWQVITNEVAHILGAQSVVAILWGKSAQELSIYFEESLRICSSHPSPLSVHRGFFGSKPFSRCNQILTFQGFPAIEW